MKGLNAYLVKTRRKRRYKPYRHLEKGGFIQKTQKIQKPLSFSLIKCKSHLKILTRVI